MSSLSSRPYHAFFSYSHKDQDIALILYRWLTEVAGFQIWFDENSLESGSPVATKITEQMSDCRNWIFLASKNSLSSPWVAAERDQAIHFNTENSNFRLIVLRIDDCQLNQACPSLARFKWLEIPKGVLNPALAREIINQLDGRLWSGRQTGLRDIYISRGWRPTDSFLRMQFARGYVLVNGRSGLSVMHLIKKPFLLIEFVKFSLAAVVIW